MLSTLICYIIVVRIKYTSLLVVNYFLLKQYMNIFVFNLNSCWQYFMKYYVGGMSSTVFMDINKYNFFKV